MKSEKVKEIKKALECCNIDKDCMDCPYSKIGNCIKVFNEDILTLINELEKEVETRKEEVLHLQEYGKKLIMETELKQFAEKLKEKCEWNKKRYCCEATVSANDIDETLKEFICLNINN